MDTRINVRFFDRDLKFIGEMDAYIGLEFISRWTRYGEFKIFVYEITEKMQKGHYIMLDNDYRKTGIIKRIQNSDAEDTYAEIDGFTLLHILTQRITCPPLGSAYHSFHAHAEDIICALVTANAVDAADAKRNIPYLEVIPSQGRGDVIYYQTRYDCLNEAVQTLCEASGLGVTISLDPERKKLTFEVLEGIDRSADQTERPPMIFNREYDNVYDREYTSDMSEYKNCAITAGQGDGAERKITVVGDENTGIDRYELFVDARDIEDDEQLPDRGNSKLMEYACVDSYSSAVDDTQYKVKWNLGDIVVAIDREYGLFMNERIVEITETFDESGYVVTPTFGTTQKTIIEKIQAVNSGEPLIEGIQGSQGEQGAQGIQGEQGYSLQYQWQGTQLGVKREDETSYQYTDLQGPEGKQGIQGVQGETGPIGKTGQSAYDIWLSQDGNAGKSEAEFLAALKGAKGDTGATGEKGNTGDTGPKGDTGGIGPAGTRGSRWNTGTAVTGTSTTATIFSGTGITDALVGDMYLNTATGRVYQCTVAGAASTAKWVYAGSIRGATGAAGSQGEKGETGPAGSDGTIIYIQTEAPTGVVSGTVWLNT